jgi:GDP-4-dehydro-6-deoxy-D-mannose reductase
MIQRVLITGISGFCARHLARRLNRITNIRTYGIDIKPSIPNKYGVNQYKMIDITDENQVNEVVRFVKPDVIYHLAGLSNGPEQEVHRVNLIGSLNVLEAVRRFSPNTRLLMVGSAAEYGLVPSEDMPIRETHRCAPLSPYGISKHSTIRSAIEYARSYSMKIVMARPFNIIGAGVPSSLVIGAILSRIRKAYQIGNGPVEISVGNIDTERDFISVDDVVEAYINMVGGDFWGEVFNICSGVPRTVRSVLECMLVNSSRPVYLQMDPALVRSADVQCVFGSPEKAYRAFGLLPKVSVEEALKAAWDGQFSGQSG